MNPADLPVSRRRFLQASGAVGLGAMLLPSRILAAATDTPIPTVARKKFGRTGVDVSALGLGCMFDIIDNQVILRRTFDHGVTYWDTAAGYERMGSETGIGMFFEKNPEARKEIFLVTKGRGNLAGSIEGSLRRLKTDHVDLFFIHGADSISQVDQPEIKAFAEKAKKDGKIKFFGFSTHSNMPECLKGAAKLGWIDGIMLTFNYREMHRPEMQAALDACEKAGIGLTAMKTMASRSGRETPEQAALLAPLTAKEFTPGQAKLKVVMEHPQIACACVQMPNMRYCQENIAAALDRVKLDLADRATLERYAAATCAGYCSGCRHLCESALATAIPVRDVMRHLMYHHHYPEVDARALFAELPVDIRTQLPHLDYASAERVCPNRLPIGRLMREAAQVLA
jgi:predicted aldo/keto reductase-like oxidoreductase